MPTSLWSRIVRIWSAGDAAGILIVVPLVLSWWCPPDEANRRFEWLLYLALGGLMYAQLALPSSAAWPLCCMTLVPLGAFFSGWRVAGWTTTAAMAVFVIWQTVMGRGPLAAPNEHDALLNVQLAFPLLALYVLSDAFWVRRPWVARDDRGMELLFSQRAGAGLVPAASVTALGVTITLTTWTALLKDHERDLGRRSEQVAQNAALHFERSLQDLLNAAQRIAERWMAAGGTPEELWRNDVAKYSQDYDCLQAVEWIDSDTVVRWIEPLKGNDAALGVRLSDEPIRRITLEESRSTKAPALTSIIDLKQGGRGFLMYVPLEVNGKSDGFIVAVFRLADFMTRLGRANAWQSNRYELSVYEGDRLVHLAEADSPLASVLMTGGGAVNVLKAPLRIVARPTETEKAVSINSLPDLVLNAGLMLSTLIGVSIALVAVALEHARRSREASRAKELFLATMSHEIRTPMNGVLGAVELALSRTSDAEARSYLSLADQSGRTLLALLNNILDFSKL